MAKTMILTEQELTFSEDSSIGLYFWNSELIFVLTAGETYTVVWDDQEFSCIAEEMELDGLTGIGLGNKAIVGIGDDTEEPFIFAYLADYSTNACYSTSKEASHTVTIYQGEEESTVEGVILKDRNGIDRTFEKAPAVRLKKTDGDWQIFSKGETTQADITLDFTGGDMVVTPDEDKLFSMLNIPLPENLIPENIKNGEIVCGILGTLTGGSGEEITLPEFEFSQGSFSTASSTTQRTITHGLSKMPDLIIVHPTTSQNVGEDLDATWDGNPLLFAWGVKSTVDAAVKGGILQVGWGLTLTYGIDEMTDGWKNTGAISCPDETSFTVGQISASEDVVNRFIPNATYHWFAYAGLMAAGVSKNGDHTVTFMSEDGTTVLCEKPVMNGDTCGDPVSLGLIEKPTKEKDAQYTYGFAGWSLTPGGEIDPDALVCITEDKTLYAGFIGIVRYYTVRYYDGDTLLHSEILSYGMMPSYEPEKEGYTFRGWNPELAPVTGEIDYYAQWTESYGTVTASGQCGDAAYWEVYDLGTLRIYGEGATYDYGESTNPEFYSYSSNITNIVVEDGITYIGKYLFYFQINTATATISSTVETIGKYAFYYCPKLTVINGMEGVVTIGDYAFYQNGYTDFVFPDSVVTIGECVFAQCKSLVTITIGENVTQIGKYLASNSNNLTSIIVKNPNGWYYTIFGKISVSSAEMSDPTKAASLLKSSGYVFNRE